MKMRLIAAAVLLPVVLVILFLAPPMLVAFIVGGVCAVAAYELLVGTKLIKHMRLIAYTMLFAFLMPVWSYFGMNRFWGMLGLFVFMCLLFGEVLISHGKLRIERLGVCLVGGLLIPFMVSALVRLLGDGSNRMFILIPFVLAFLSDSGAYFVGRKLGKHKLAPVISPNKSIEGLVGGVVTTMLSMVIYCLILDIAFPVRINYFYACTYGIIGAFAGTFGDLTFSAIKRQTGIKDYGNLIPGHGGLMDRLDSIIVVSPLTELLLEILPVVECTNG